MWLEYLILNLSQMNELVWVKELIQVLGEIES